MLQWFATLPTELKLKIVKKCQAIPYVRLRQTCRYMNEFCEDHRKFIGIYIYRKTPELFLLNSLKETFPFHKQIGENEEDIDVPYAVVEYGRLYGQANLKVPMNKEHLPMFKEAISGFNFPEISILNYNDLKDEEENSLFNEAFDCFMEILADLHVDTVNIKGLTREQYDTVISKLDISYLRLRKAKINAELVKTDLAQKIRHFSCTFPTPPDDVDFQQLLKTKSIATIDWGSQTNNFDWQKFEQLLLDYDTQLPEMYFYRFYFEDEPNFYKIDLTAKEGRVLPTKALHIGPVQVKEIPNADVECPTNQELIFDYWISEISTNRWMMITISRKSWSFCTDVCVLFDTVAGKEELNMSFLSMLDDLLLNGSAIDYSDLYEKLEEAYTLEEKKQEMLNYLEFIPSLYLE